MSQNGTSPHTITGVVASVNERGVKVGDAWYNVSRYSPVTLPDAGQLVTLTIKGDRWIEQCSAAAANDVRAEFPGGNSAAPPLSRDAMIARHVALKAAVAYCAAREQATTEHILPLASRFESWLTRPWEE